MRLRFFGRLLAAVDRSNTALLLSWCFARGTYKEDDDSVTDMLNLSEDNDSEWNKKSEKEREKAVGPLNHEKQSGFIQRRSPAANEEVVRIGAGVISAAFQA